MSKRLLLSVIVALIITNIATFLFWKNESVLIKEDDEGTKVTKNEYVAQMGNEKITYKDWMRSLRETHGKNHLKHLIDRSIVEQMAKQEDIQINDKVMDREIALLTTMHGMMTKEEAELEEKKWREDILHRYQLEALLTEDVTIPEEEIRAFYDGYRKQYDFIETMQLSHIVVDDKATAEKVISELGDGASFDMLAQEYSNDTDTNKEGGYLGFLAKTSQYLPNEYYDNAVAIEEYSYSEPIQTDEGIAVLYLHRNLPGITFTYDEIKPYIENELGLNELESSLIADPLWEQLEIEWIYEE